MGKLAEKKGHWLAFWGALAISALVFLPFVIYNHGYFFYYGDFNVQQIPFYQHAHTMVRSGQLMWDWQTDLGANFVASYSFYLLFSPFFWLTLLFPTGVLPYLMAPLLALKTACAALTAYFYIRRFVIDKHYAIFGAWLYAFSGFMVYNIFFNHFHEAAVFFPLMLIGLEELLENDRRGLFAAAVAVNAMVNYWFFIGEVVFVILYFFVRTLSLGYRFRFSKLVQVAFEGVLGVALSAVVFMPSVLAIMGNPRTGTDNLLTGWGLWVYSHPQRLPALLHAMFFPPDLASLPNFFPDHGAKWASLSAYLPLFGMTGVLAYCGGRKGDWLKRMLVASMLMAAIPALNALFVLLNNSYYTRWLYMPILLMSLATVLALENPDTNWRPGLRLSWVVVAVITLAVAVSPQKKGDEWVFGLANYPEKVWANAAIAAASLLLVVVLVQSLRDHPGFKRYTAVSLAGISLLYSAVMLVEATSTFSDNAWIPEIGLRGREELRLPEGDFVRIDVYEGNENLGLYWERPSIQTFHSIVPVSLMEFYPSVGVKRDVSSKPEARYYPLRSLLSVRWLFIKEDNEEQEPMPGYRHADNQLGFNIYENKNHLPMGFAYDSYINRREFDDTLQELRGNLLLKAVLLEDEAIERHSDILRPLTDDEITSLTEADYIADVADRRAMAATSFKTDNLGFTAEITLQKEALVFFSVPWEQGWSASIDGEPVQVERASIGFMAVRAPAGSSTIRFDYRTYGLKEGAIITGAALLVLLVYLLLGRGKGRTPRRTAPPTLPPLPLEAREQARRAEEEAAQGEAPPEEAPPAAPGGAMKDGWHRYEQMLEAENQKG